MYYLASVLMLYIFTVCKMNKIFFALLSLPYSLLAEGQPPMVVETVVISPKTFKVEENYIGTVESANFSLLKMKSSGTVASILVKPGDLVKKGQVLVTLRNESAERAFFHLEKNVKIKKEEFFKSKELYKKGDISKVEFNKIKSEYNQSIAQSLDKKVLLSSSKIEAPFAGIVGLPQVFVGNFVTPEMPIITIQNSPFYIKFRIPASRLSHIKSGQKIQVISKSSFGMVEAVEKSIDPKTRTGFAIALLNKCPECIVGESVSLHVIIEEKSDALLIPKTAIFYQDGVAKVFVRQNDEAKSRVVTLGKEGSGQVLVLSGLLPKEEIVSINPKRLYDSAKIRVSK